MSLCEYKYYEYQSPLNIIRKAPLIVYGYIRKYKELYPKDIIKIIYNFSFIKILSYQIKIIGDNKYGQQGIGNCEDSTTLTKAKTYQKTIKNITNGDRNIYILFTDSTYECCGNNKYGQLGINMVSYKIKTFVENNNIKINNIFSSPFSEHAFCIDNNNKIYACGWKYNNKWTQINTQVKIQKISTGKMYTNFVNNNGQLFVYGNNSSALGLGEHIKEVKTITEIPIQTKFMDIHCGYYHTLALDCNGQIWSWGNGKFGQLGHGDVNNRYVPTKIEYFMNKNIKLTQICCGGDHSLVLSNLNKIYAFGWNWYYQCGNNNNKYVLIPQLNETLKNENIITIKCGWYHNMAANNKNQYYLWGYNRHNQCIVRSSNPPNNVKKPLLFEWKHFINKDEQIIDIFLGSHSTCVLIGNAKENNLKCF